MKDVAKDSAAEDFKSEQVTTNAGIGDVATHVENQPAGDILSPDAKAAFRPEEEKQTTTQFEKISGVLRSMQGELEQISELLWKMHEDGRGTDGVDLPALLEEISTKHATVIRDVGDTVIQEHDGLARALEDVRHEILTRMDKLQESIQVEPSQDQSASTAGGIEQWARVLLSDELYEDHRLVNIWQKLVDGVLSRDAKAQMLVANLMLVQSASSSDILKLLKDVGETYYRWRPKRSAGEDPMEQALIEWLNKRITAVGLRNVLELVNPGDRFDPKRHISSERGVEIADVMGFVVLRDNGKVLTRASVSVK